MPKKQKLELTWIGKDVRPKLEPRILLENPELSFHAEARVTDTDIFDNILIHGDNLLALKALEQEYTGKVKCIYIDPPYNTGSAFEHYDDGVEHSLWLSLMRDRLEILRRLLAEDGTIWITLDQNEVHYFKVMADEVFGRKHFIADIAWRSADSSNNDATQFSIDHNSVLVYAKSSEWVSRKLTRRDEDNAHYSNPDNDPKGPWFPGNLQSPNPRQNLMFSLISPAGHEIKYPKNGWRWSRERMEDMISSGEIVFTNNGTKVLRKTYLCNQKGLSPSSIWWDVEDTGHNRQAKYELKKIFDTLPTASLFKTPKPEKLIQKILNIATDIGDIVLDSFLGSGTTAAVAHKMGRRWIGIELGEHCYTYCIPRLKKIIQGKDFGGVTFSPKNKPVVTLCKNCQDSLCEECREKVGKNTKSEQVWFGGGGFRFYELGPSLIRLDAWGNPVINPEFNPEMLAEALCKLENFTYAPSPETFWIHGQSSEADFIYVTTQFLTQDMLTHIAAELGEKRSLLICCGAYSVEAKAFPNITIKKIPKAVLEKCEWGKDDYSLAVENLPQAEPAQAAPATALARKEKKSTPTGQASLFDATGDKS